MRALCESATLASLFPPPSRKRGMKMDFKQYTNLGWAGNTVARVAESQHPNLLAPVIAPVIAPNYATFAPVWPYVASLAADWPTTAPGRPTPTVRRARGVPKV